MNHMKTFSANLHKKIIILFSPLRCSFRIDMSSASCPNALRTVCSVAAVSSRNGPNTVRRRRGHGRRQSNGLEWFVCCTVYNMLKCAPVRTSSKNDDNSTLQWFHFIKDMQAVSIANFKNFCGDFWIRFSFKCVYDKLRNNLIRIFPTSERFFFPFSPPPFFNWLRCL